MVLTNLWRAKMQGLQEVMVKLYGVVEIGTSFLARYFSNIVDCYHVLGHKMDF